MWPAWVSVLARTVPRMGQNRRYKAKCVADGTAELGIRDARKELIMLTATELDIDNCRSRGADLMMCPAIVLTVAIVQPKRDSFVGGVYANQRLQVLYGICHFQKATARNVRSRLHGRSYQSTPSGRGQSNPCHSHFRPFVPGAPPRVRDA